MAASNEIPNDRKLNDIFSEAYTLYESFSSRFEPTNTLDFQLDIKKCISLLENATRLVSIFDIFSKNENYNEISAANIKFLLLPYLLGQLTVKLTSGDRNDIVNAAETYYLDFIQRCNEYEFPEAALVKNLKKFEGDELQLNNELLNLIKMAQYRNNKLLKYKQKKILDDEISQLDIILKRDHDDETTQKEFYVKLIQSSILDSIDEISSISMEKQMLQFRKLQEENPDSKNERSKVIPKKPLKTIIITRDAAQKAIYGAGYPSLPMMTVAEFYDERVASGIFPDGSQPDNSLQSRLNKDSEEEIDREKAQMEQMEEVDDVRLIERNRAMDKFKDEHRRGEGNRYNRS